MKAVFNYLKEIKDTANEEELYYYAFYLVNSFYEKLEFREYDQKFVSNSSLVLLGKKL